MNPCSNCCEWIQGLEWRREHERVSTEASVSVYRLAHLCSALLFWVFIYCGSIAVMSDIIETIGCSKKLDRVPLSALIDLAEHLVSCPPVYMCAAHTVPMCLPTESPGICRPKSREFLFCEILFMFLLCILSQLRCKLVFLYPELQDIDWINSQLNDSHWFGH